MTTVCLSDSANSQSLKVADKSLQDSSASYRDGIYEGTSRSIYITENYWGRVCLTLKNRLITEVSFVIRDSNLHETFNANYEKHFAGIPLYIQQSRNDWKGVQAYDAVSGATWSYNIFKASVNNALENAK
jgi:uncharacterized protein with FMN-binding domain